MRNDVKLRRLDAHRLEARERDRFLESVFFHRLRARMGSRGVTALRTEPRPLDCGLFVAGIFDRINGGLADNRLRRAADARVGGD